MVKKMTTTTYTEWPNNHNIKDFDNVGLQRALYRKGWNLYQWTSSSRDYVWTYYVRDDQGTIVCEADNADEALEAAKDVWNHRKRDAALVELNKKYTRQLLHMLGGLRLGRPYWWYSDNPVPVLWEEYEYTEADVRNILKHREHVMNQREARKVRKEKAQEQRTYERNRLRNRHHKKAVHGVS